MSKKSLPSSKSGNFLDKVKEVIEIREGIRGSKDNAFVTYANLKKHDPLKDAPAGPVIVKGDPPAPPANLQVESGMLGNTLRWDESPSPDVWYYEVWVSQSQDRGSANLLATVSHPVTTYIHSLNATNVTENHYYWIRAVSWSGLYSIWEPPDAQGGYLVEGSTSYSEMTSELTQILENQITETQLYNDLNDRIDLIDGSDDMQGSVAQRIKVESENRAEAIDQVWITVGDPEDLEEGTITAAVETHAQAIYGEDGLHAQYSVKVDNDGYVAGFGLSSEPVDGELVSSFIVNVDHFAIGKPEQATNHPFIVGNVDGQQTVGINGQLVVDGSIFADAIGADEIKGHHIQGNEIIGNHIKSNEIEGFHIKSETIESDNISANAITSDKINVGSLSAITADLGTITAGKAKSDDDKFIIDFNEREFKVYDANNNLRVKIGRL